jgi:protein DGCR14
MNGLMFPPDAYTKPFDQQRPKVSATHPPSISHRNTRIADEEEDNGSAPSIRGNTVAESWVDCAITGGREEYALLDEADPDPEDLPPLMTYGTLLATPRALDGSNDPLDGPTYKLPEPKSRDELGRKLGTKASKAMSERARAYQKPSGVSALRAAAERTRIADRSSGGRMGPPATPRREGNLTPAARSLLDRSLGRTPRGGLGLSSAGSARGAAMEKGSGWGGGSGGARSWTPSPAPRRPM